MSLMCDIGYKAYLSNHSVKNSETEALWNRIYLIRSLIVVITGIDVIHMEYMLGFEPITI